jgi:opacity protein-like surface antigen
MPTSAIRILVLSLLLSPALSATASADTFFTPFAGINFGGTSGDALAEGLNAKRLDWGFNLAFMGSGVLGIEADIAHSPDFYGQSDLGGSSVLTATGNLLIGIPFGGQQGVGVRPYVLAGIGVIRSELDNFGEGLSGQENELAWDIGGGAMFFFSDHIGLRTDLRYFRTFNDVAFDFLTDFIEADEFDKVDFARASVGLILRF